MKSKKATINPVNNKDNKSFQYAVTVALNHEKLGKHSERITKIKPFINSKEINLWWLKKIEKNNVRIALNVLHAQNKKN